MQSVRGLCDWSTQQWYQIEGIEGVRAVGTDGMSHTVGKGVEKAMLCVL